MKFLSLLTIAFIVLKLTGVISWGLVLLPVILSVLIFVVRLIIYFAADALSK